MRIALSSTCHLVAAAVLSLGVVLGSGSVFAESTASGSFASTNMHATFKDVYAYRTTDEFFDEVREVTEVVISDQPLDKQAIAEALKSRGEDSTTSVLWDKVEGAFAKLTIDAEGATSLYLYVPPGYNLNMSGFEGAAIAVNTPQRIEGTVNIDDTDSDGPRKLNLTFAADVGAMSAAAASKPVEGDTAVAAASDQAEPSAAAKMSGEPLPAGGGEPGQVFQEAMKAQRAGDVDAMLKFSNKETREKMLAEREKPEFAQMMEFMKQMAPPEVIVTRGVQNGDTATLDFDGKYADGGTSKGTVDLLQEDGAWVIKQINENISGQ